jgi:sugar phosphate isomerase/epimerase
MHDRLSVHAVCFRDANLSELAAHWRNLGIRRVSLYSGLLESEGLARTQAAMQAANFSVETVTHNFLPYGQQVDAQDVSWERAQEDLIRLIADAATLGARSIELFTGGHGALTWEDAAERIGTALSPCVSRAKSAGVALIVENTPPVYASMHLAHSLHDAVTLAELTGVGVCIDVFSCWSEAALKQTIERAIPRTSLVQLGDYVLGDTASPGRAVPGDGNIPLRRIIDWILQAGYQGTFEIEVLGPRIDAEGRIQATQRACAYVADTLRALGA